MLQDIDVLCDKPTDCKLFKMMKGCSETLAAIRDDRVQVLPDRKQIPPEYKDYLNPLLEFDRADYYFCLNGRPLIVAEITEHGYTGDQCMQRFARISKTAEMGIPFIYFAPVKRTRYDELDSCGSNPSYRNVNRDMYLGFSRLTEVYDTPVVALPWNTASNGIPMILGADGPAETGLKDLFDLIGNLLVNHESDLQNGISITAAPELREHIAYTEKLATRDNVRKSEVRYLSVDFNTIRNQIEDPTDRTELMPRDYFFKGKAHKLFALMSLDSSRINKCILPDGRIETLNYLFETYGQAFSRKKWLYYFSGYQWRSEPNVGIVTNIDHLYCRELHGRTVSDRKLFLCVHWPRVFWDRDSTTRKNLLEDIKDIGSSATLNRLADEMLAATGNYPNLDVLTPNAKVFGNWNNHVTVARIFRNTCDLIILNDAVIVGNMWQES